jgi:hypothetical protein
MTKQEFNNASFKKDDKVIYRSVWYLLKAVDFERMDLGLILPNCKFEETGLIWVNCANCAILYQKDVI